MGRKTATLPGNRTVVYPLNEIHLPCLQSYLGPIFDRI